MLVEKAGESGVMLATLSESHTAVGETTAILLTIVKIAFLAENTKNALTSVYLPLLITIPRIT